MNGIVIGAGIAGLSSACFLAKGGMNVLVVEKNDHAGGRASLLNENGFRFDMGPSWYWMPEVFERFFNQFGKNVSDYYELKRLDPSYRIFYGPNDSIDIPASIEGIYALFESIEEGSSKNLERFLGEARFKYEVGMHNMVYKPGLSLTELVDAGMMRAAFRMHLFRGFTDHVRTFFKSPRLIQMMEFPVMFLGAMPSRTPALYSLMNYADIKLGTWYPMGGMYKIPEALSELAASLGVEFKYNTPVNSIVTSNGRVNGVDTHQKFLPADFVVAGADYPHVEQSLLDKKDRSYSDKYWDTRKLAPSCLIYYLGIDKKVNGLEHHNLFFDADFDAHLGELFDTKVWPSSPLFYVCAASKTDPSVAPGGCENLFILIPVTPGLTDTDITREYYYDLVIGRMEKVLGEEIGSHVIYKKTFAHRDFSERYNAFRGNGYGLANTLRQTSVLRPAIKSKKVKNLYFTGQFTVPGPGVPPALISGEVTANEILQHAKLFYERTLR